MTPRRDAFRSSAIIGGSSVINMLIGTAKIKVLAVLLGPAGIGLMGLYLNIMNMTAMLVGCGTSSSGVRQIATTTDEAETLSTVRRALWLGSLLLGAAGMSVLWLFRLQVAVLVFEDSAHASSVGWLGLGVLLTLMAGSQTALLQGLRRIGDLAKVNIFSAVIAAIAGVIAVYYLGEDGVLWFVLFAPAISFIVGGYYTTLLEVRTTKYDLAKIQQQWFALLKLGIPLMAAGLLTLVTQLLVRSMVLRDLGLEASGHFHAAWTISMTYVAFVLNAMAMEFYPRLTGDIKNHERAKRQVNEQTEMALLLAGPILMAMFTFAPWVISALYSVDFAAAAEILRWQILGDILKILSMPVVFIFLANGNGGTAIAVQCVWCAVYLGIVAIGINEYGLFATGPAFLAAYIAYFVISIFFANRVIGYRPTLTNSLHALLLLVSGAITLLLAGPAKNLGFLVGVVATIAISMYSLYRLDQLLNIREWLRQRWGNI